MVAYLEVNITNLVIIPFPPVGDEADLTRSYPEVMTSRGSRSNGTKNAKVRDVL
jgi:hypothetical protein